MNTAIMQEVKIELSAEQRKATAEALKIATKADKNRRGLRALQVFDGRAFVTDGYVAVQLPWLGDLPEGVYDADGMYSALKGASSDKAEIEVYPSMDLSVSIFTDFGPRITGAFKGTFVVSRVEDAQPVSSVAKIFDDAVAMVEAPEFQAEPAGFSPDRLAQVMKCAPSYFEKSKQGKPVLISTCGLKPAVLSDGEPFAIIMPMRMQ
jgi:hypothetical protein